MNALSNGDDETVHVKTEQNFGSRAEIQKLLMDNVRNPMREKEIISQLEKSIVADDFNGAANLLENSGLHKKGASGKLEMFVIKSLVESINYKKQDSRDTASRLKREYGLGYFDLKNIVAKSMEKNLSKNTYDGLANAALLAEIFHVPNSDLVKYRDMALKCATDTFANAYVNPKSTTAELRAFGINSEDAKLSFLASMGKLMENGHFWYIDLAEKFFHLTYGDIKHLKGIAIDSIGAFLKAKNRAYFIDEVANMAKLFKIGAGELSAFKPSAIKSVGRALHSGEDLEKLNHIMRLFDITNSDIKGEVGIVIKSLIAQGSDLKMEVARFLVERFNFSDSDFDMMVKEVAMEYVMHLRLKDAERIIWNAGMKVEDVKALISEANVKARGPQ